MPVLTTVPRFAAPAGTISFPIAAVTAAGTTRSPTFTLGTAPAADDYIFIYVNNADETQTITDATDWTNVLGANTKVASDANCGVALYHRVTSAEAGASTVTWTLTNLFSTGSQNNRTVAIVLRGVSTSTPISGSAASGFDSADTATPWVIPSVTPGDANAQVVAGVGGNGTQTQTTPGGWTLQAGLMNTIGCFAYSLDTLGSAGVPTGTTNVTPSGGDEYCSIAVAFKPA